MSLAPSYFDNLYEISPDPWGLGSREYEARKYGLTMAALPRRHYKRVFEPGCSIGVLTRMLAERAESVVASDVSLAALECGWSSGSPSGCRSLPRSSSWTCPTRSSSTASPTGWGSISATRSWTGCCTRSGSRRPPASVRRLLSAPWEDVATALQVSAYSFKSLAVACLPLLGPGSSIVGMDFDNRQAWPAYDWMGVAVGWSRSAATWPATSAHGSLIHQCDQSL